MTPNAPVIINAVKPKLFSLRSDSVREVYFLILEHASVVLADSDRLCTAAQQRNSQECKK